MKFDLNRSKNLLALTYTGEHFRVRLVREDHPDAPERLRVRVTDLLENPQQAGTALAEALAADGLSERRCVLCIPPSWAMTAGTEFPDVSEEDLRGYFELRAEREFSATDLRLAHQAWTLPDGQRRATLAAISEKHFEAVAQCIAAAGLRLVSLSLTLDDTASTAVPTLHLMAREDNRADVFLTAGDGCALLRSIDVASLARELRITLGRLPEPLRPLVRNARIVSPRSPALRAALETLGFESIVETAGDPGSTAVVAARRKLRREPIPFEFLPPEPSRWPKQLQHLERYNTPRGRRITAAAAAVTLFPFVWFLWNVHTESRLNAKWNNMKASVADLETLQQKIRQFRPWFDATPTKLQPLRTLISAFPEQGEVWTRSVTIAAEKPAAGSRTPVAADSVVVNISGFARNQEQLKAVHENLRKQPGVSAAPAPQIRTNNNPNEPLQFSFNFKWQPHD